MVKLYKDLGKTAKKLLNDDFVHGSKKVELKTKTDSGMTYTTTGVTKTDGSLIGDLSCKYSMSGATLTTKIKTSNTLEQEIKLENTGVKGLALTLFGSTGKTQSITGSAEYIHPHIACTAAINALGSPVIKSSLAIGSNGVTIGVDSELDTKKKALSKWDAVVNYSDGKDQEVTVSVSLKKAKFAYSHLVSRDFSVAAEFNYDRAEDTKSLVMGTKYLVDRDTTLKAKIESTGNFYLSYLQEIRSGTTLTLSSKFDVTKMENAPHQFGLSLVIE